MPIDELEGYTPAIAEPADFDDFWRGTLDLARTADRGITRERVPSPLSAMMLEHFGGAVARVPRDATAFDQRDSEYNLVIVSRWADPGDRERNVAWARETSAMAAAFTNGRVYVNYIGAGEAPERVRAAFGPEKFARLADIKKKYDPANVFRMNQNIPPAG